MGGVVVQMGGGGNPPVGGGVNKSLVGPTSPACVVKGLIGFTSRSE